MAAQTGTRTTFNSTVGLKIDLSDTLPLITSPDDVPLWTTLSKSSPTLNAVKHQWQQDTLLSSASTLNESGYDDTETDMTVADGTLFKAGYVIKIESELQRVVSVSSNVLTTVRGYAGSTAASHSTGVAVSIVGYAVTDGADPAQFSTTNRTTDYNYHQVFQEAITVSELEQWAQNYGVHDKYSYEVMKWLKILAIRAEKTLIHGKRYEDATYNTRTAGGLLEFITTNATAVGGALSATVINDALQDCYDAGGYPKLMVVGPSQKRALSALITTAMMRRDNANASDAFGQSVDSFISDFGTIRVLMDRNMPSDTALFLEEENIKIINGRPFTLENLAKTGTATKGEIVGWFTLEVKAETHHAVLTTLT